MSLQRTALVQTKPVEVKSTSTFDPAVLHRLTRGLEKEGRFAQKYAIADDDDQADVAARFVDWKKLAKKIDAYYDEKARAHLDALTTLRALIKPFKDIVALGLGAYSGALGTYEIAKAERHRAALEGAKDAARARDNRALTRELNAAQDTKPQTLRTDSGASVAVPLCWQVDGQPDESVLAKRWMMADVKALNEYAAGFQPTEEPKPIAGVTFKLAAKTRVRA